jgi:hypothetical protein
MDQFCKYRKILGFLIFNFISLNFGAPVDVEVNRPNGNLKNNITHKYIEALIKFCRQKSSLQMKFVQLTPFYVRMPSACILIKKMLCIANWLM